MANDTVSPREYIHTPEMGEISGFGGGYEDACQQMLHKGVQWLEDNKKADLKAKTYQNVYGIFTPEGEDAKALSDHITKDLPDITGAMHQAVMSRLFWIAKNGWEKYVEECSKPREETP